MTVSGVTRSFTSPRLMVYGSGADSTCRGDLLASSRRRLYSSSGSVTFPGGGTGGRTLSCANAGMLVRNATASTNFFMFIFVFIAHLPFSRADNLGRCWEPGFRRLVRKLDRE